MYSLIDSSRMSDSAKVAARRNVWISDSEYVPDPGTFHAWVNLERYARQRAVVLELKGNVADLSEPGSQIAEYEWGSDDRPARVWYASYGSNMDKDRFLAYVQGGTAAGSSHPHDGCRDRTPPQGDIPIRFRGRAHFAYFSRRWEGGVAFLDHDGESLALGRAYNVSMEQFDDIVAQENGRRPGTSKVPVDEVLVNGSAQMSASVYGTLEHIGDFQGAPVFTFTGSFTAQEALNDSFSSSFDLFQSTPPSPNYLRMLGSGLRETFGMSVHQQADYLRGFPGMEGWGRKKILHILRTPPDKPPARRVTNYSWGAPVRRATAEAGTSSQMKLDADSDSRWDEIEIDDGDIEEDYDELWARLMAEADAEEASSHSSDSYTPPWRAYNSTYAKCLWCGQYGHKMNDCPEVPSNR